MEQQIFMYNIFNKSRQKEKQKGLFNSMKKMCLHDISIHINIHQNRSINECDFGIKEVLYDLG